MLIETVALGVKAAITHTPAPTIPLILLLLILGLPGLLIVVTAHRLVYVLWMLVYLLSLPIWNFVLPAYAYWHFDDFSWGDTRQAAGGDAKADKAGHGGEGEFDSSKITMKRWGDFEQERRLRAPAWSLGQGHQSQQSQQSQSQGGQTRSQSQGGQRVYSHGPYEPRVGSPTMGGSGGGGGGGYGKHQRGHSVQSGFHDY